MQTQTRPHSSNDPLAGYKGADLSRSHPLTAKNESRINPEAASILRTIAAGNGVGQKQLRAINKAASVSSLASDQSAVSTWHFSRYAGGRNQLTFGHKRQIVSADGFKTPLAKSQPNWYEKNKQGGSGCGFDTDNSKIMVREVYQDDTEQRGDFPSFLDGKPRKTREAMRGITLFNYFDDNPDKAPQFDDVIRIQRYHPSERRLRAEEAARRANCGPGNPSSVVTQLRQHTPEPATTEDMLRQEIDNTFGYTNAGTQTRIPLTNPRNIEAQYIDFQAMIKAALPDERPRLELLNYLMAKKRFLITQLKRRT